ncbi:MAG: O-antigen/teichoic acid export membrane protein [Bacteroidia bacterium]|jgi:O-antigen/teichoic acid export membrane protein
MGVIVRQSFKAGIIGYLAVILGFINTAIIYPYFLDIDEFGQIQWAIQGAIMFTPFITLGFNSVGTKFFGHFANTRESSGKFLGFLLTAPLIASMIFGCAYLLFRNGIIDYYAFSESGIGSLAIDALVIITIISGFITMLNVYCANYKRIAIPSGLNHLIKVTLPILSILYFYGNITYRSIFVFVVCFFVLLLVFFGLYLFRISKVLPTAGFKKIIPDQISSQIYPFAFFGILAGLGSILATRIDVFMIGTIIDSGSVAIYTFAIVATNTIALPITIVAGIATPIIAIQWKENNMLEMSDLYRKSTISLSLIAVGIFLTIWSGLDALFELMPKGDQYAKAKWCLLILGLAKVVDLSSGLNSQILSMSERYKAYFYFLLSLAVLNFAMNLILVPRYQIEGAAIATFTSIVIFNFLKFQYLKSKYSLQPFGTDNLKIFVLGGLVFILLTAVPKFEMAWINLFLFPILTVLIYAISAYKLKLSSDVNALVDDKLGKYFRYFNQS